MVQLSQLRSCLLSTAAAAAWSFASAVGSEPPLTLEALDREPTPDVLPASEAGEIAEKLFQLPDGIEANLWAAEPMLANPVGINFDNQGRLYVAETYRYGSSTLDIRGYMGMLEDDLDNRTLQDRLDSIQRQFGDEGMEQLAIEGEVVRLLEDRDGDGVADFSTVYADGFNTPLDGVAADVLPGNGGVYFANIPSLWFFQGSEKAGKREEILRGFGIRFGYTGHDLHGLAWGPDGKLYFSVGDRGAHVETNDGRLVTSHDTGCVFRCNPDGTELEVVHIGLRNPQDLLFTENGDLFTGDNDSDQGDIERLVQVIEGGDSGWRIGYQFAPLGDAGPWNKEGIWHPRHEKQPAHIVPPVCLIEDGPSGVAYYPGTGLSPEFEGTIFITHFLGSIARSGIQAYRVEEAGATYRAVEQKTFLGNALPTDVAWGPDGRLYYSDWADGWPKSKRGRIYAIDHPGFKNDSLRLETQKYLSEGMADRGLRELSSLLGHADQRVRLEAQFELARRGEAAAPVFVAVAENRDSPRYARFHAVWGIGQLAHAKIAGVQEPLLGLLSDDDSEVRAQAAKVLGDHGFTPAIPKLAEMLKDGSNRARFFAAQSLGKLGDDSVSAALIEALRDNDDADPYLRHSCVYALSRLGNTGVLLGAADDQSDAVRLGVLLALRRLGNAEVARFLEDENSFIVAEAARAINDEPVVEAYPALAAFLGEPVEDEMVMMRALNAAFRVGGVVQAEALAGFAADSAMPAQLRSEALRYLSTWGEPPQRDRIVGIYRPLGEPVRQLEPAQDAVSRVVARLLAAETPETVQQQAFATIKELDLRTSVDELYGAFLDENRAGSVRAAALLGLEQFEDPRLSEAVSIAGESDDPELRLAALGVAAKLSPEAVLPVLESLASKGGVTEQRTAYEALAKMKTPEADRILADRLRALVSGDVVTGAQMELLEAAEKSDAPEIKKLLAERETALASGGDAIAPYEFALKGGDFRAGRRVFNSHPGMPCLRCHQAMGGGGSAGPDLSLIGAQKTPRELLEAIIKPNATIAEGFESVVVETEDGEVHVGSIASENDGTLSLRLLDGSIEEVAKSQITSRTGAPSAMPEIYQYVLSKRELRDLMAFLVTLRTEFTDEAGPRAITPFRGPQTTPEFDADVK